MRFPYSRPLWVDCLGVLDRFPQFDRFTMVTANGPVRASYAVDFGRASFEQTPVRRGDSPFGITLKEKTRRLREAGFFCLDAYFACTLFEYYEMECRQGREQESILYVLGQELGIEQVNFPGSVLGDGSGTFFVIGLRRHEEYEKDPYTYQYESYPVWTGRYHWRLELVPLHGKTSSYSACWK